MSIKHKLKNNLFIRGCGVIASNMLSAIKGRSQFMRCADNVIITPPYIFINPKNIFLGPNTCIGAKSYISALNAKLICKGHCAIAENFTVHTGNHARVIGLYVTEVTEENKPKGYDKDVIIEEDVWIGCNVTILSGVTIGRGSTVAA